MTTGRDDLPMAGEAKNSFGDIVANWAEQMRLITAFQEQQKDRLERQVEVIHTPIEGGMATNPYNLQEVDDTLHYVVALEALRSELKETKATLELTQANKESADHKTEIYSSALMLIRAQLSQQITVAIESAKEASLEYVKTDLESHREDVLALLMEIRGAQEALDLVNEHIKVAEDEINTLKWDNGELGRDEQFVRTAEEEMWLNISPVGKEVW